MATGEVGRLEEMKSIPDSDRALAILKEVKATAEPVLKARGWSVGRLIEMCCCDRRNMGMNLQVGGWCRSHGGTRADTIAIRLRHPKTHAFYSFERIMSVMWHEMTHIKHGAHSAAFYALMDELRQHFDLIKSKNGTVVGMDGFPVGPGRRMDPSQRNPRSMAQARAKARDAAEQRASKYQSTANKLGGGRNQLSAREAAARAAILRAQDLQHGLGDAEIVDFDGWCVACGPVCLDITNHAGVETAAVPQKRPQFIKKKKKKKPVTVDLTNLSSSDSEADDKKDDDDKTLPLADDEQDEQDRPKIPKKKTTEPPLEPPPAKKTKKVDTIDLTLDDDDDDDDDDDKPWACSMCTFENAGRSSACIVCAAPRFPPSTANDEALARALANEEQRRIRRQPPPPPPQESALPAFDPCKSSLNGIQDFRAKPRK